MFVLLFSLLVASFLLFRFIIYPIFQYLATPLPPPVVNQDFKKWCENQKGFYTSGHFFSGDNQCLFPNGNYVYHG